MLQADGVSLENALGSEQQTAGGLPGDAGAANSSCSQLPESLPVPRYRNHHEAQQEIHPALALNPTKLFVSSSQEIEERWGLSGALPGPPARPGSSSSSSSSNSFTSLSSACSSMEFEERWGLSGALPGAPARPDSPGRCGHYFCKGDMTRYVRVEVQNGRYPLHCPEASCQEFLAYEDVSQLLLGQPALQALFEKLAVTGCIDPSRHLLPLQGMQLPAGAARRGRRGSSRRPRLPLWCPECHKAFCLSCGIKGWHEGMMCAQFQALPPELRSAEDAAVLRMAQQHGWKRCPGCGHIVVRKEGCNHMRCHCGAPFCYKCGELYKDSKPTAQNVHGTPSCECPLLPDAR
ncbi:hypothetical protein OEZ86_006505 [Tetradesmus obliquus]|nr:hypothetical protein OEZ86_006505 [Tetradesmus obliquus]